jgi:type II secretory pathway pseudopilin PulG
MNLNIIHKIYKQRGDTIIEVMMSLVVIGLSLGLAYGIVNRSIENGRSARERTAALKLAESQLEFLSNTPVAELAQFKTSDSYCIYKGSKIVITGDPTTKCIGDNRNSNEQKLYDIELKYTAENSGEPDFFESIVKWGSPSSPEKLVVNIRYSK